MQNGLFVIEQACRAVICRFANKRELARATTFFKYGVKHYPDVPDAYNGLAYGYEQAGQLEDALIELNKAIALANEEYQGY